MPKYLIMKRVIGVLSGVLIILVSYAQKRSAGAGLQRLFPNTPGSNFTYAVTDSDNNKTYKVTAVITGINSSVNNVHAQLWTFTYPDKIDTNYVVSNKDSVVFYDKTKTIITNSYHFPLKAGKSWGLPYKHDTIKVIRTQQLTVKAGLFAQVFYLKEQASAENYRFYKYQWVVPNIGMIKTYSKAQTFGHPHIYNWELISYHIK